MPGVGGTFNRLDIVLFSLSIVLTILSTIAVSCRFWARKLTTSVGWDDRLSLGALVFAYGELIACMIVISISRGGKPFSELTAEQTEHFLQAILAYMVLLVSSVTFSKLSVLFFYGRIFSSKHFRIQLWILAAITTAFGIATINCLIFQAEPVQAQFEPWMPHQGIDMNAVYEAIYGFNAMIDIAILFLPQPQLWRLQIPLQKKLGVSLLLLVGVVTCIIAYVPFISVLQVGRWDSTSVIVTIIIWAIAAIHSSIICSCAPMFPKLFKHWYSRRRRQLSDDCET